ncbi:finTRIM family, member 16 isoform X1 [Silurus asotus]|uniref:FinTRIM family, member 16 isoform X1 n=1 Tax=Silurus asotus TaxID=30991 RepID=A0AAD5AU56_SILAS|nr:finTRIM family, member 16 isoform X1 [Silurus asotus]
MAEANIFVAQDQFSCPICLDLLKDPVAILCGHSFCMRCINGCWDQEDQKGVYSCPQCRQTFTPRPAVSKNTVLAEVIETLKSAGIQAKHPAQCPAGPEDVECDFCSGRKNKAVKSCLVCLASFCETHLQPHYESPAFKKHKLVEVFRQLQEQICSQHGKLLEVYCRNDQQCICMLCTMDEHKQHDTVSAAAGRAEKQDQFSCPICLDLLKDPVALQCGHSFCMRCINGCWDQEDQKGVYSCPQCRQTFTPRPAVSKNTVLAEVIETLKRAGIQAKHPAQCPAGPEDVKCDFCSGRKDKAVKSCLVCLASFCKTHLQPHYESPAFKKHKLVEAFRQLQEQICSQHGKLLEVYCLKDQQCICMMCMMVEHQQHNTVTAAVGRAEKQKPLLDVQAICQQKIKKREQELQELTEAVETHKHSAQTAVQETKNQCTELIISIKRTCTEMMTLIKAQEKAVVSQAEEVIKKLEKEIAELKKRNAEIEELSHTEDPIYFLQSFKSLVTPGSADLPTITTSPFYSFKYVERSVSQFREKMEACFKEEHEKISSEDFCQLTLDPNTAHQSIQLSDSNRMATCRDIPQIESHNRNVYGQTMQTESYEHPESFSHYSQVLCNESVCERAYWEVDFSKYDRISIAVSCKDISRKGSNNECAFGRNKNSWSLICSSSYYLFLHNNQETRVPINQNQYINYSSLKIGVFLDYKLGSLSFYSVSDTMKLLHRVRTTFTKPLYPGFGLNNNSTVKLCNQT